MATQQSQAVNLANGFLALASAAQQLGLLANQLVTQYGSISANNTWNSMVTSALNADGSLGTADGSPNVAHVIDTRVVTGLNRSISPNNLVQLEVFAVAFQAFMSGAAVSATLRQGLIDQSCN